LIERGHVVTVQCNT